MFLYFTENEYEKALLELFRGMGYEVLYGPEIERDYKVPFYGEQLLSSIRTINPDMPADAIAEAVKKLQSIDSGSLVQKNAQFMDYLQNGIEVSYYKEGEVRHGIVYLVDYLNYSRNTFQAINQWTYVENSEKRADIIVFVNGLPLVLIELKSPSREETDASAAYRQIRNYMKEIPSMFIYNAFCVMSDMACSKAGTITSGEDRFMEWKTKDGQYETTDIIHYDTFFEGMFRRDRLLDIMKNFCCFSANEKGDAKILAGYHQYFAVRKAVERTVKATSGDGKIGVFWHTQGSGKSLSMVFYAHLIQQFLNQPTIIVITDRNDLDEQLYGQFSKCARFLRQVPEHATSRDHLKQLLRGREANGIIFTTMQKFEESTEPLSERRNIVVMTDEAHRGQYGFEEKIAEDGRVSVGMARIIRDSLPHASFIGFTGTPISQKDKDTQEVFGDYIDIYDMTQSVRDGATCPVYYESRVINLKLDQDTLKLLDNEYDLLAEEGATAEQIEKSKHEFSHMEELLGAPETIDSLVKDILHHYEDNRQYELTGKAMIVAYSRPVAIKIYKRILELRPDWTEKVKCVMTGSNNDPEEWHDIIGNKQYKQQLAKDFKDDNSELKIAIVVDMWLTGFDVPSLATMYVFKPMAGHNLMQAIARVNRVFAGKPGGLVVDYIGIAKALKEAMRDYTKQDRANFGDQDIHKTALVEFLKHLEVCQDYMHGFDFSNFRTGTDADRASLIQGGANFMMDSERADKLNDFLKEALLLKNATSLCRSLLNEQQRFDAGYFDAVRTLVGRLKGRGPITKHQINERIGELLKQSIKSEGVINLFQGDNTEFSLFDKSFLDEIAKMKSKNIAIELLKKLLAERVSLYQKTNIVQAQKFSELLNMSLSNYLKGMLTNEEVIRELIELARQISSDESTANELGLNSEEMAFYDALTRPRAIKDFYSDEQLVQITKELTDALRKNRTIDWQKKESARAGMRSIVKRLLRKYHYPPEDEQDALDTVIRQCEQWADVDADAYEELKPYNVMDNHITAMAADPDVTYVKRIP